MSRKRLFQESFKVPDGPVKRHCSYTETHGPQNSFRHSPQKSMVNNKIGIEPEPPRTNDPVIQKDENTVKYGCLDTESKSLSKVENKKESRGETAVDTVDLLPVGYRRAFGHFGALMTVLRGSPRRSSYAFAELRPLVGRISRMQCSSSDLLRAIALSPTSFIAEQNSLQTDFPNSESDCQFDVGSEPNVNFENEPKLVDAIWKTGARYTLKFSNSPDPRAACAAGAESEALRECEGQLTARYGLNWRTLPTADTALARPLPLAVIRTNLESSTEYAQRILRETKLERCEASLSSDDEANIKAREPQEIALAKTFRKQYPDLQENTARLIARRQLSENRRKPKDLTKSPARCASPSTPTQPISSQSLAPPESMSPAIHKSPEPLTPTRVPCTPPRTPDTPQQPKQPFSPLVEKLARTARLFASIKRS